MGTRWKFNRRMKCISGVLFIIAAAVHVAQSASPLANYKKTRWVRSASSDDDYQSSKMFECFTREQHAVQDECWEKTLDSTFERYVRNITGCIDANVANEKNPSLEKLCNSYLFMGIFEQYSECVFQRIGEIKIAMDPVDLASFKTATIEAVELDDAKKTAALADFDSCMEATESVPFSFFSFRKEKIPPLLQNYTYYYQIQFGFDRLSPSPSIRAIDCMETVLMQNDCATTSQDVVNQLMRDLNVPETHRDKDLLRCLSSDSLWFYSVCDDFSMHYNENRWTQNCTRGAGDDTGCRARRVRQFREVMSDCLVARSKVSSVEFHQYQVEGSSLGDKDKAAAMASFDECMARQVARPYQFFQSELEMISGSQLLRNVTSMYNRVFGFGNLEPTDNIRVTDCSATSLILNGCSSEMSDESLTVLLNGLIQVDRIVEAGN